ncbi:MAG TPA: dienelactone hydrolase family protein [Aggregatilineales bacterium]|nr:dienelactone hydrolase family protein [Aggregatilineales bacterium]
MQAHQTGTFRSSIVSVLGAPPDPCPLEPQIIEVAQCEGYRREHVKYQVSPGDWGYAYLLVPNDLTSAVPAVVVLHRHENRFKIGKDEIVGITGDPSHAIGLELVRRGYVVFAPDALGFGERRSAESDGDGYDLAYSFNQLALRLLRGETLLRKAIWDISRGLDYLETRTEVDLRFIGFMGHGFGGAMAMWSAAMDPRIRAAVSHGGVVTYRQQIRRGDWFQVEFVVPRLMQVADMHHILGMIAPRPFLLSMADGDALNTDTAEIYQKALRVYEAQGTENRLSFFRYHGSDTFDIHMRNNAYDWLDSWLKPF